MANNKSKDILKYIVAIVAIILAIQASKVFYTKFDLTEDDRFTLNEKTIQLLENLEDVVEFKIYLEGENLPVQFVRFKNSILENLNEFSEHAGDNIEFETIDIYEIEKKEEREQEILRLQKQGIPYQAVTRKTETGTEEFFVLTGCEVFYKGRSLGIDLLKKNIAGNHNDKISHSIENLEYELTNAIRKLIQPRRKNIGFLQGHGELGQFQVLDLAQALSEYYTVGPVLLSDTTGKVDIHALDIIDLLIIAKPLKQFNDKEQYVIDQFIMRGGKTMFLVDGVFAELDSLKYSPFFPAFGITTNLEPLLFKYGVKVNNNIVEDMQCTKIPYSKGLNEQQPQMAPWVFFPTIGPKENPHKIVDKLDPIRFEFVSTLEPVSTENVIATPLLFTSGENKYRKTPTRIGFEAAVQGAQPQLYNEKEKPVAYLLEGKFESYFKNRIAPELSTNKDFQFKNQSDSNAIIVIGDGDVAKNMVMQNGRAVPLGSDRYTNFFYDNRTFLLNCVNYLTGDEDLISVRSKKIEMRLLNKKALKEDNTFIMLTNVWLPPAIIVLLSLIFAFIRKKRFILKNEA